MNYYNQRCPQCKKVFTKDDDIVVCPVCGTPQHRECYEEENRCVNAHMHLQGYVWEPDRNNDNAVAEEHTPWQNHYYYQPNENEESYSEHFTEGDDSQDKPDFIICGNCGTRNDADAVFCKHCSASLSQPDYDCNDENTEFKNNVYNQDSKFGFGSGGMNGIPLSFLFDNIKDDDKIAENVTVLDADKYIQRNTALYNLIFRRIYLKNRSRFNFAAFLFSGGWFLYRKQYFLGTILTLIMGICICGSIVFLPAYYSIYSEIYSSGITSEVEMYSYLMSLPFEKLLLYSASSLFKIAQYIVMIISGIIANRCYYKHVVEKVVSAKENFKKATEMDEHLKKSGGVDTVLGYILLACYAVLTILPSFMFR